jgi:hypothetical protein
MKGDECGMNRYEGENLDDEARIFYFEGEYGGERVWIVLEDLWLVRLAAKVQTKISLAC